MEKFCSENFYVKVIELPEPLKISINRYLNSNGLSDVRNPTVFKHKNSIMSHTKVHIDSIDSVPTHCSIILPICGTQNTKHYWYCGDYHTIMSVKQNIIYEQIVWDTTPKLIDSIEISNGVFLTKADIPHGASSNSDYRITATFRFSQNESFDYISRKLSN